MTLLGENAGMEVEMLDSSVTKKCTGETCVICETTKDMGIHLYTSFICYDCEMDMIKTDTDNPKYKYYLKQLRKVTTPEIYS
jgi:hypothetical protein